MKILVACEESQAVCKAFRARGHEAYSADIQDCSGGHPEWHIKGDVLEILEPKEIELFGRKVNGIILQPCDGEWRFIDKWDLIIAHPPCTYMSKAGACRMYPKAGQIDHDRFQKALDAKKFFMEFYNCSCPKVAIENPVPLKCVELPKESQTIQPYKFDTFGQHPWSKATRLWLKGLPKLTETTPDAVKKGTWMQSNTSKFSKGYGGNHGIAHDAKTASKTFPGIAEAMAEQWG